ncbi:MAG: SMC-Scp complex subunit ScpB [Gammaproteobacteria bacterium]|nr:SMC-Scp complex subunit ScpB [Gammaproteobacteria bacterium]
MSETGLVQILEGALLAAGKAMTVAQLADLFEEAERPEKSAIREALQEVAERCEGRGFELTEVASGFRFQVRQNLSPWVARLWHERPQRYSRALLETLALIAYRQPITRGEIEEIRGVAVSSNIIKTLHEREWIRVVGHRDVPGRPAMYATTKLFLDYFNLKSLDQLPALAEIRDLDTLNAELGFSEPLPEGLSESKEAAPGLTVVGGTEHVPAAIGEVVPIVTQGHAPVRDDVDGAGDANVGNPAQGDDSAAGSASQSDVQDTTARPETQAGAAISDERGEDSRNSDEAGEGNPPAQRAEDAPQGLSLSEAAQALESRAGEPLTEAPAVDVETALSEGDPAPQQQAPAGAADVESAKPESQS